MTQIDTQLHTPPTRPPLWAKIQKFIKQQKKIEKSDRKKNFLKMKTQCLIAFNYKIPCKDRLLIVNLGNKYLMIYKVGVEP